MTRKLVLLAVITTLVAAYVPTALATGSTARRIPKDAVLVKDGPFAGAWAVEAKAETPDWYTDALHRRVLAARTRGEGVPLPENAPVNSALLFAGIRPGSWMISPNWCTLNFVFGSAAGTVAVAGAGRAVGVPQPEERRSTAVAGGGTGTYIGTAGHCASVGEEVTIVAAPGVLMNIGKTVKSVDGGIGNDFALIEIYPEMLQYVNPSMAIIAGPTGAKQPALGDPILHVGHGLVIGTGGTARPGVVTYPNSEQNQNDTDAYGWNGAVINGDSGSGARFAGGEAVGNVTHIVIWDKYLPATFAGTTITRILEIAGAPLVTASLVPDPLP